MTLMRASGQTPTERQATIQLHLWGGTVWFRVHICPVESDVGERDRRLQDGVCAGVLPAAACPLEQSHCCHQSGVSWFVLILFSG